MFGVTPQQELTGLELWHLRQTLSAAIRDTAAAHQDSYTGRSLVLEAASALGETFSQSPGRAAPPH